MKTSLPQRLLLLLGALWMPLAGAEQAVTVGTYTIHYNALPTQSLPAEVASTYGIRRSGNRGLVNVAVLKRNMELTGQPVEARVQASATNLNGQLRKIPMRRVTEQNAIYYIGEFGISNEETLRFTIEVKAEDMAEPTVVRFDQQFFGN